jgi:hypothetical protein
MFLTSCRFPRGRVQSKCIHLLNFKRGMFTVHGILLFIKRLTSLCLQSLHHHIIDWTKSDTATSLLVGALTDLARSKSKLVAENAPLRQQLIILRRQVKRPACAKADSMLLVFLASMVRTWKHALFIVQPETLLLWHHRGFRLYWKYTSRAAPPTPKISPETVALIRGNSQGQSTVGSGTDPGSIARAGSSRVHTHDSEIHETSAPCKATRTDLENLLTHLC